MQSSGGGGLTDDIIKSARGPAVWTRPNFDLTWRKLSGLTIILKAKKIFLMGPLW